MKLTGYIKCPSCGTIFKDINHATTNLSNSAPCCGKTNESRELWPSIDILILMDIVEKQNLDDYRERKVAIVFVSTLLEMLLEEVIGELINFNVKTVAAAESLLESYQGRMKRISLFNKLSGLKFNSILKNAGFDKFFADWERIATIRNRVIHQGYYGKVEVDVRTIIQGLLSDCLEAFSIVNNEITKLMNEK